MKCFSLIGIALLALVMVSCRTRDDRSLVIYVPEMKNQACSDIVVNAIKRCQGVNADKVELDLKNRKVIVSYDSLILSLKNIEFAVADAGFQANEVPAKAAAQKALPPECTR